MTLAVTTLGLLVFVLGALGLLQPPALMGLLQHTWRTRRGLYLAFVFRAVFGVLLIVAAGSTRFPWAVGVIGGLALISAVAIPLLGYARLRTFVDWWVARSPGFIRAWSVVACAFGAFLIYAAS